ncbi:MAG TPA: nicotinate-nicotinamide nucleotide adenylyltransferase [Polyangiaceae bacterium]
MNVAVFGGSFNPPHVAHVMACRLVTARPDVDRMLVVPTFRHPFAKELAPYEDRVRMCELAMADVPCVEVSRVEAELGGESRTLRTLERLAADHPTWKLRLVIGADILGEAHKWFGFDAIRKLAPPIVLGRAGVSAPEAEPAVLPGISSTAVREAVAAGAWDEVATLVPAAVAAFMQARGLYGAGA